MNFRLDHVVIAVSDLAKTVEDYRALGFTVQIGGRHAGRTSHNALIVFADGAYIELIAWSAPGPAERWYNMLVKHGEGLMDFALIPDDVPRAIAEAKIRGLEMAGPIDGGRVRPDGQELKWQTARQATFDLPFLCGDVTPRDLRVPDGPARIHANGAQGIAAIRIATTDVSVSLSRYRALLGGSASDSPISVGDTQLHPAPSTRDRGEGPFQMSLRSSGETSARPLDPRLTHGAGIALEFPA